VKRREFIKLIGGAAVAWPLAVSAQQQGKVWQIGVLSIGSAATARHLVEAFSKGMADLGYQEGRNVHYEVRYGEGSFERFEQYAREYASAKVDLIWASGTPAATAAQKATASIPVIFALVGDPVFSKLVRDLRAPGANVTGMSLMISEMWEKRVRDTHRDLPNGAAHRCAVQPARLLERRPASLHAKRCQAPWQGREDRRSAPRR
jgi:putative ABC transport system substrate-binding protein